MKLDALVIALKGSGVEFTIQAWGPHAQLAVEAVAAFLMTKGVAKIEISERLHLKLHLRRDKPGLFQDVLEDGVADQQSLLFFLLA